jgi:hypothetical protein
MSTLPKVHVSGRPGTKEFRFEIDGSNIAHAITGFTLRWHGESCIESHIDIWGDFTIDSEFLSYLSLRCDDNGAAVREIMEQLKELGVTQEHDDEVPETD